MKIAKLTYPGEHAGFCCKGGQVNIPLTDPPQALKDLLMFDKKFKTQIRTYNNLLSMTSLGFGQEICMPGFSPFLKFQGKIYHAIGPLRPEDGQEKCTDVHP